MLLLLRRRGAGFLAGVGGLLLWCRPAVPAVRVRALRVCQCVLGVQPGLGRGPRRRRGGEDAALLAWPSRP